MNPNIFPVVLIILDLCAAVGYASNNLWIKAGYWFSAGLISIFATLMKNG